MAENHLARRKTQLSMPKIKNGRKANLSDRLVFFQLACFLHSTVRNVKSVQVDTTL
jgi:hypothetical protein